MGNEYVCPECGNKDTERLELVPGTCAIEIEDDGSWFYAGGWDPEYNDQLFSGIWQCPCGHEWGKLEPNLLAGLVGEKWVVNEGKDKEHELYRHMILNGVGRRGEHHPIDLLVCTIPELDTPNSVIASVLCDIWRTKHQPRIPRDSKMVLRMVHDHYPPGHHDQKILDYLAGAIGEVIKERRKEWEPGTPGALTSPGRRGKKPSKS